MKKFFCIVLIICTLFALSGCGKDGENIDVEKGLSEVRFLENQCITIFNKYLSNEYLLEDNNIDWNSINEDFGIIRNSIDVVLIDLASIQVPSKNIVELENSINELDTIAQSQDMDKFMRKVCDIYNLVSYSILDNISNDEEIKLEKKSKSDLLYVGYYLMQKNKEFSMSNLDMFQDNYSKLSSNKSYIENNSYKINKVLIYTKNLRSKINSDDYEKSKQALTKILEFF